MRRRRRAKVVGVGRSRQKRHETTQYPQPLQTSFCTSTEPTSVRTIEPVGQASRQPASSQCLQTSERKIQRNGSSSSPLPNECEPTIWFPFCRSCSTNITCRHVDAPRWPVLS